MYKFLRQKKDRLTDIPLSRFNLGGFYNGDAPFSNSGKKAYFLDGDIAMMDANFFQSTSRMLPEPTLEPGFFLRWFPTTQSNGSGSHRELFCVQLYCLEFGLARADDDDRDRLLLVHGCVASTLQDLYTGERTAALVGGVNLIMTPTVQIDLSTSGVMSSSGLCKSLDASEDGYGRVETVNVILLERLDVAVRNGDASRAVIRATSMNNDGRTVIPLDAFCSGTAGAHPAYAGDTTEMTASLLAISAGTLLVERLYTNGGGMSPPGHTVLDFAVNALVNQNQPANYTLSEMLYMTHVTISLR
ncbi:hypothetical protein BJX99DRAFT_265275 [Aspergillus californicus]